MIVDEITTTKIHIATDAAVTEIDATLCKLQDAVLALVPSETVAWSAPFECAMLALASWVVRAPSRNKQTHAQLRAQMHRQLDNLFKTADIENAAVHQPPPGVQ